jgi:transketolase
MGLNKELEKKLYSLSYDARILTMKVSHKSGNRSHYGGHFSTADILTVLYQSILKIDPKNPKWNLRDHFIFSKGHAALMLSSVLHLRGFFDEEFVYDYEELNSPGGWHTTIHTPGVELAGGSLGHGLGFGIGLALAKKLDQVNSRVFVYMGDGEIDEGSVWEGAMAAGHYKLDNLTAIIDRNNLQITGNTEDVMSLEPLEDKWRSFGWSVKTINGHDMKDIYKTLSEVPLIEAKPTCIIAKTIKGKGLPFIEDRVNNHLITLSDAEYSEGLKILKNQKNSFLSKSKGV